MKLFAVTARAEEFYYVLADDKNGACREPNDKIVEQCVTPEWEATAREVTRLDEIDDCWRGALPFLEDGNEFEGTVEDFFNVPPEILESGEQRARRIREELEAAGQLRLDGGAA